MIKKRCYKDEIYYRKKEDCNSAKRLNLNETKLDFFFFGTVWVVTMWENVIFVSKDTSLPM